MEQQGILDLVLGAGPVVQLVLYLLILFSVVSWGIILFKYRHVREAKIQSARFIEIFWESRNLASIHEASQELEASPVAHVFVAGYEELLRVSRRNVVEQEGLTTDLSGVDNVARAMKRAANVELTKLEQTLTFLATTSGSTPFIGLFGTVWGIMNAFAGIGAAGSTSLTVVAPGIAEALIATAAGLFAAIPAVYFYNYLTQRLKEIASTMDDFAMEFLNITERNFS
jgi:biopolymer transport protein TolQ